MGFVHDPIEFGIWNTLNHYLKKFPLQNFNKLWPEKYDFDICKGFLKEEIPQTHQISQKDNPNLQILMMSSSR
jgi:hypothetical protein